MDRDLANWPRELEKGNFSLIHKWLIKNVHSQGNLYDPADLMRRITGEDLTVGPYLKYLDRKYSELFDL